MKAIKSVQTGRHGQALMFVTLSLTAVFGLSAMVFDMGVIYHDQSALTASTQAAALAGAEAMAQPGATTDTVTAVVTSYSSGSGDQNASSFLSGASLVTGYPMFSCLSTLTTAFGTSCYGPSNSNAIVVRQKVSVPLFFLRIFGGATRHSQLHRDREHARRIGQPVQCGDHSRHHAVDDSHGQ